MMKKPDFDNKRVYKLLKRILPITNEEADGKFFLRIDKKMYYTRMFVVIIMLATTDVIFALDSIPPFLPSPKTRLSYIHPTYLRYLG
jgi:tellurite resistance protein TerC